MGTISALLVGESWQTIEFHVKGFDLFSSSSYTEAIDYLQAALTSDGIDTTYQPCHVAASSFPETAAELGEYDVVVLSDIGYNTLAIPPETFGDGARRPDRLRLIDEFVRDGGGLLMIGGYLSFQGINGRANYAGTPVEDALPVAMQRTDDRVERSDGVYPEVVDPDHPVLANIRDDWPDFLGYNRFEADDDARELVRIEEDPFLVVGDHGSGRSAAFASDCAPHWGPMEFVEWESYPTLWADLVRWLANDR
ncbi:hypothetical protein C475_06495 [Halosimplex carlsbadense 2-9-1]|uniref:Putative glutamine amidotransferase domain-containing protein n=1 Tax=Halosimplex carlsbadense 2-9-1 TaxID=797114 RepID=M0CYQ7_9EURY|nr:glutamine amidotransferase [Halosimplex carlsbadense]ELZ27547.1 hypothetical protein C475_06495 [Halosimplex carlsbadense 2-9-1]